MTDKNSTTMKEGQADNEKKNGEDKAKMAEERRPCKT